MGCEVTALLYMHAVFLCKSSEIPSSFFVPHVDLGYWCSSERFPHSKTDMYVASRGARRGPCLGAFVLFQLKISPYYQSGELFTFLHAFPHNRSYGSLFSFLLKFSNSLSRHCRLWSFGCLPNQMVAQHLTQLCRCFAPLLSLFSSSPLLFSPPLSFFFSPLFLLFVMFGREILISSMLSSLLYCYKCVCFRFCSFLFF